MSLWSETRRELKLLLFCRKLRSYLTFFLANVYDQITVLRTDVDRRDLFRGWLNKFHRLEALREQSDFGLLTIKIREWSQL